MIVLLHLAVIVFWDQISSTDREVVFPAHTRSHGYEKHHQQDSEEDNVSNYTDLSNVSEIMTNAGDSERVGIASSANHIRPKTAVSPESIQGCYIKLEIIPSQGRFRGSCITIIRGPTCLRFWPNHEIKEKTGRGCK
jgi:hypothetical protein